ncbi:MAG: FAD-dependent oxidoreductase [Pseudomonadota bacterium]
MRLRRPGLTRRVALTVPLLSFTLGACRPGVPAPFDGGWIGAAHERGHRLRETAALVPAATRRCAVAIVGAGVAGLGAARALRAAGVDDIQVFELEDEAGGNARGHHLGGMTCPLGAHYLPLPGPDAHEVSQLLHELGLLRVVAGRSVADDRHLCHSPQERLWIEGQWIDGLLPPAARGSARERQYRRFSQLVADSSRALTFTIPTRRADWQAGHATLDAITFAHWLDHNGLDDVGLRWYLDYACRDDYGASASAVSAWAGLQYFASRHGFQAPGDESVGEREAVFTWPEGNAWLTRRLAAPLGDRLHTGVLVRRVDVTRHEVAVDVEQGARTERWLAQQVIIALPLHVASRIVAQPPTALVQAAAQLTHAPWLVANLQLRGPLTDKPGAPPSWDNVLYGTHSAALGYVDAMHQSLRPAPGPTVLSAYWALGDGDRVALSRQRRTLLDEPWSLWSRRVVDDLARAHPDLPAMTARVDLMRYGHAMAIPAPGLRGSAALQALAAPTAGRLHFAHSDLAAYSIFEEAFTLGHAAGVAALRSLKAKA